MTTHLHSDLYSLVDKGKWVFSRVGSRCETATEPIHGERIVSQPFKTPTYGNPIQEHHNPIWGEPLGVLLDCGHIDLKPHQEVLDGFLSPCSVCRDQEDRNKQRKAATLQRRVDKIIQEFNERKKP